MHDKAKVRATFAQYKGPDGLALTITATGEGGSRRTALFRAIRNIFKDPAIFHKSPDYIRIDAVTDATIPLPPRH